MYFSSLFFGVAIVLFLCFSTVIGELKIIKISSLPTWRYVNPSVHLHNSNKQHLILAKFCINNGSSVSNQSAKFQLILQRTQV